MTEQASINKELERYQLSYREDGEPIAVRRFGKKNVFFLNVEKEMNFRRTRQTLWSRPCRC